MEYRREIDGLRAVAVLPVILFHSGLNLFPGGFVGVDIFFVISGYLITSILLGDLEAGKFSILKFYERRARRILPALFALIVCAAPFAWLLMTPAQAREFWQSVMSIAVFGSNIFFWLQSGYFDGASELKPLLHTWSLAVEEQYYVLFPPLLALIWRWNRRAVAPLLAIAGFASLGLSAWAAQHYEGANFYLTPMRAWELVAGVLCACHLQGKKAASIRVTPLYQLFAGIGLALVLYAIFQFNDRMRFPGLSALVPVGGTTLIILFAWSGTWVARLLSLRAMVGIGLISYSAYLWHLPLFAFARLQSVTEPSTPVMLILAAASLVMGWLSWRFVELPFRVARNSFANTRKRVFLASGVGEAALIGVGALFVLVSPPTYMALAHPAVLKPLDTRAYEPQVAYSPCPGFTADSREAICRRLGNGPKNVVIWGDSHAVAMSSAAHAVPGYSIYIIGHWGCPPLIGVERTDSFGNSSNCNALGMTDVYGRYTLSLKPETVFLVSRWTLYAHGRYFHSRLQRDTYFLADIRQLPDGAASSEAVMTTAIGRTVDMLKQAGSRVYVVQQVPDLHDYSPRGLLLLNTVPQAPISSWHQSENRILAEGARHGATIIPTHDLFCAHGECRIRNGDQPLYIDDSHLNSYGAEPVFARLVSRLNGN